jgi:BTB/POZ domain
MELKSMFFNISWNGTYYVCKITEASITKPETEIKAFVGEHSEGKTNDDVEMIWFDNTAIIEYVPYGLHKIFPNLKVFYIGICGLKKIARNDLTGLEKIEIFWIWNSKLRSLPSDLFKGMTKLKNILLGGNKLEFLSSELLEPILDNQLEKVDIRGNTKINALYQPGAEGSVSSLQEFLDIIDKNCDLPLDDEKEEFDQAFVSTFESLRTSGQYSDLIIIGGASKSKEFRVHKIVLASQSRVLSSSFPADGEVMKITDFSTETVEHFLRFMYTGKLKKCNATEVFMIASKYEVILLKKIMEKIIVNNINETNVFRMGYLFNSDKIKRAAFEEIEKMFPERVLDYNLIDKPEDLDELIEAHHKAQEFQTKLDSKLKKFEKMIE